MNHIVKLHDGSEEIVSEEELEAAAQMYDSLIPATGPTPGPWGVEPEQATHGTTLVIVSRGEILARSNEVPHYSHPSQMGDMHNFTLMAAAPNMRDVLTDVAALLPAAGRMHPQDLFALQTRVVAALALAGVK